MCLVFFYVNHSHSPDHCCNKVFWTLCFIPSIIIRCVCTLMKILKDSCWNFIYIYIYIYKFIGKNWQATWPTGHNTSESARWGHRHPAIRLWTWESLKVPSWGWSSSPFTSPQLRTRHSTLVTTSTLTTCSSMLHLTTTTMATPATYRHALQLSFAGSY